MKKFISIILATTVFMALLLNSTTVYAASSNNTKHKYTEKEIILIARVVYAESRGEPFLGKVAVAQVVMNRFEAGYGKTVASVVFARHQFCVSRKTNSECIRAVRSALIKKILPKNTYFFRTSRSTHWRKGMYYYKRIGHHSFFTLGKAILPIKQINISLIKTVPMI